MKFSLDDREVEVRDGESIWSAAERAGVSIPRLCHKPGYPAAGNCRACVVEIEGERVLAASCCRTAQPGMKVKSSSTRAVRAQKAVLELLLAAAGDTRKLKHDSELGAWADRLQVVSRYAARAEAPAVDRSHAAMTVDLSACIQCTRCVRACRTEQVNDVIGMAGRGSRSTVVFDQGDLMGDSTCVGCGECVQACPTGALAPANGSYARPAQKTVDSVCPYCGVGCQVTYHVENERIVRVDGRDGSANESRLCVKGRFGYDYIHHPGRLTVPLVRKQNVPKDPCRVSVGDWRELFREASWDEALELAANGLSRIRDRHGPAALAGFGSAKGTNEEAYLFQKLVRTGFGSNNVDHCTRLCHASSVAALMEGIGSGAVSNPVRDVELAEVVLVIGANPTVNHPVAATWMKNAAQRGVRFVLADPRRTDLARHAWKVLQFNADTDIALLNALVHAVIDEGLENREFLRDRASAYEELRRHVRNYSPEAMAPICGVDATTLREVARAFATSGGSMILWGMGVSQHVHGTDNARALIALCLVTGQIGRPGTGLHPLRGQNNVQGASDAGLIPMMLPDYSSVGDPEARGRFEASWGVALDPTPGLTVVEVIDAAHDGLVRGMYVEGENPAMSDPDAQHAREALARLEHLVVQDIFLTETAALADVILPATAWPEKTGTVTNTDRCVQLGRQALQPPGQAKADLWLIAQMGRRLGLDWQLEIDPSGGEGGVAAVYEEMRSLMPSLRGISWRRLVRDGSATYPCETEDQPGNRVVFTKTFPTWDGRARLVPATLTFAAERPDEEFPLVLITGRQLEHWHTGTMTRRSSALDALEPAPTVSIHPSLLRRLRARTGEMLIVESRRGRISLIARADEGVPEDAVFIPFAYAEAAANLLTNPALDPEAKIAEVKYCAVRVRSER
ncbi:MAG: 2Fe-2S iron-sulfur cluster binding domain protein [Ramlibacter sp.]|jgi:formate dehydrogenase major subunit|nr:2Fe-2S iron-sulfur cluster binding domain protein [Ramlibacter sp.]